MRTLSQSLSQCIAGKVDAESMGRAVLASQFVSGLRPEIEAKIAGTEGSMDALLTKARLLKYVTWLVTSNRGKSALSLDFQVLVSMARLQNHQSIRKQAPVRNPQ